MIYKTKITPKIQPTRSIYPTLKSIIFFCCCCVLYQVNNAPNSILKNLSILLYNPQKITKKGGEFFNHPRRLMKKGHDNNKVKIF